MMHPTRDRKNDMRAERGLPQRHSKGSASSAKALGIGLSSVQVHLRRVTVDGPSDRRAIINMEAPRSQGNFFSLF